MQLVSELVASVGAESAARELHVAPAELGELLSGSRLVFQTDPTIRARLFAWARSSEVTYRPSTNPPFDHLRHFWENFYSGPRPGIPAAPLLSVGGGQFLGFDLTFPFGVPACVLTPNSEYVRY
ncbi:MAG: hypothetical protein QOK28_2066 [Actinomycetota bacterium]